MDSDSDTTIIIESDDYMEIDEISNDLIVTTDPQSPEVHSTQHESSDNSNNETALEQQDLTPAMPIVVLDSDSRASTLSETAEAVTTQIATDESPEKEKECKNQQSSPKKRPYEECNVEDDDDDGKTCPICLDNWTNLGEHRICALKCGHLFGASCIIRWFSLQKKKSCPTCKKKASKSEMRYIFAKKLIAMDVTELEQMKAQLNNVTEEKNRVQVELTKAICREHLLVQQAEDFKKKIESLNYLVRQQQSGRHMENNSAHSSLDKVTLYMDKSLEICKEGGCRVLDYCDNLALVVVSMQSSNNLFRGFGVRKIDVSTYKPTAFIPLHQMSIRDVRFHPQNPWLLSVSLDKIIKVVDTNVCTPVTVYNGDVPLWSCCWDINNSNMFFVGKQQGSVAKFDIRQMAEPVCSLEVPGDMSPVVSVASIANSPDSVIPAGGVISCKLNSLWVFENSETIDNEYLRYPLAIEGPFISMVLKNRQLLVSSRSNARYPYSRHHLCNIETGTSNNLLCNTVHCFAGSATQKLLSRSCLVSNKSNTFVAAHQEANKSVVLWSTKSGQKACSLPARDPVLDLCGVNTNHGDLLAALTEKKLEFFKFV